MVVSAGQKIKKIALVALALDLLEEKKIQIIDSEFFKSSIKLLQKNCDFEQFA
jgi:hypothetical protein